MDTIKSDVGMSFRKAKIGEAFSLIRNGASIKQKDGASGIPITRIETISNLEIDKERFGYADIYNDTYSEFYLKNGDILMSHINSLSHLGKSAMAQNINGKIIHGMNLLLLRADSSVLNPKYAKYYFESLNFRQEIIKISNQSVNQCSFSLNKLKDLQIPLPPLPIQKRIAEILDAADALKRKDQELLKKYDELAQAIFIDMFGNPVKNEKGWEVKKIGELTKVSSGGTPDRTKPEYYDGKIPWVKTTEVNGKVIFDTEESITAEALKNSSCKLFPKDSVIIAMYGQGKTRGQVGLLGIEATTNQACGVILPCEKLNPIFLFKYLQFSYKNIRGLGRGGNQENLNGGMLKDYQIIVPKKSMQDVFAGKILNLDKQIEIQNMSISESLFQTLLQKAFKGELVLEVKNDK